VKAVMPTISSRATAKFRLQADLSGANQQRNSGFSDLKVDAPLRGRDRAMSERNAPGVERYRLVVVATREFAVEIRDLASGTLGRLDQMRE